TKLPAYTPFSTSMTAPGRASASAAWSSGAVVTRTVGVGQSTPAAAPAPAATAAAAVGVRSAATAAPAITPAATRRASARPRPRRSPRNTGRVRFGDRQRQGERRPDGRLEETAIGGTEVTRATTPARHRPTEDRDEQDHRPQRVDRVVQDRL